MFCLSAFDVQKLNLRIIWLSLLFVLFFQSMIVYANSTIKLPNVAGAFYPENPRELSGMIDTMMQSIEVDHNNHVDVMIVPHAGYIYSGQIAAYAFKSVMHNNYKTIVVIASSHYHSFKGTALWEQGFFQTPLGNVEIDQVFAKGLLDSKTGVTSMKDVFNREHALEVELPFIQSVFPQAKIVPLLMGDPDPEHCQKLAQALHQMIGQRRDVLVVISSDMSHYHAYDQAVAMDAQTLDMIQALDINHFWQAIMERKIEMCGFAPVTVGMLLAKLRGSEVGRVLKYANSGDTAGDKTKVVGYTSIVFSATHNTHESVLTTDHKKQLIQLARQALDAYVNQKKIIEVNIKDQRLLAIQGAFVTLRVHGQLRGCIGQIVGQQSLAHTIRDMTIAAASQDVRFTPVTAEELNDIEIEISTLSVPRLVGSPDDIVLGRDGVIISDGGDHQGVFLPQVAKETGWSKEEFLSQLAQQKAGLQPEAWKMPSIQLYTFTADVFHE